MTWLKEHFLANRNLSTLAKLAKVIFFLEGSHIQYNQWHSMVIMGQFHGDGRTVRTLVFGVYSYLWVIQKDITL